MLISRAHFAHPLRFTGANGIMVEAGPGDTVGILSVASFGDAERRFPDHRYIRMAFATASVESIMCRYVCLLPLWSLWPPIGVIARPAEGHFAPHARIKEVHDTRGLPAIRLAGGREHVTEKWNKLNDVTMLFREAATGLDARLTVYADPGEYVSFDYHIPLAHLLWRRAPVYSADDIMAEAADYVDFVPLGPMSKHDFANGLAPGPIRVIAPEGVSGPA